MNSHVSSSRARPAEDDREPETKVQPEARIGAGGTAPALGDTPPTADATAGVQEEAGLAERETMATSVQRNAAKAARDEIRAERPEIAGTLAEEPAPEPRFSMVRQI